MGQGHAAAEDVLMGGPGQSWWVRRFAARDVPVMARWLSDDRVLAHYGGRDRPLDAAAVAAKYLPRQGDPLQAALVESAAGTPLGYVQIVHLGAPELPDYGYPPEARVDALDLFLDPAIWGRGFGTALVSVLRAHLCAQGADAVQLDPRVDNGRAIRCYEKAGFDKVRVLPRHERHEGVWCDNWLMIARCSGEPRQERGTWAPRAQEEGERADWVWHREHGGHGSYRHGSGGGVGAVAAVSQPGVSPRPGGGDPHRAGRPHGRGVAADAAHRE